MTDNGSRTRTLLAALAIGVALTLLLTTFDAWAAPAQSPPRQSVPTKTPLTGEEGHGTKAPGRSSPTPIPIPTREPTIVPERSGPTTPTLVGIAVTALVIIASAVVLVRRLRNLRSSGPGPE